MITYAVGNYTRWAISLKSKMVLKLSMLNWISLTLTLWQLNTWRLRLWNSQTNSRIKCSKFVPRIFSRTISHFRIMLKDNNSQLNTRSCITLQLCSCVKGLWILKLRKCNWEEFPWLGNQLIPYHLVAVYVKSMWRLWQGKLSHWMLNFLIASKMSKLRFKTKKGSLLINRESSLLECNWKMEDFSVTITLNQSAHCIWF